MGHQSYILYFNTEEEKKKIIDTLNKHNELNKDPIAWKNFEIGEVIECCCVVKINKPYKRGRGANYNYAILCSNGGGRSSTFSYLFKNQIPTEGYNNGFATRVGKTNFKNSTKIYLDCDLEEIHRKNFEVVLKQLKQSQETIEETMDFIHSKCPCCGMRVGSHCLDECFECGLISREEYDKHKIHYDNPKY